jgi:hypothetical protein
MLKLTLPSEPDVHEIDSLDDWRDGANKTLARAAKQVEEYLQGQCSEQSHGEETVYRRHCKHCFNELIEALKEAQKRTP